MKYIALYIIFLLGGCINKRYPSEMVVESIDLDSGDKANTMYTLSRGNEKIYLIDSLGKYNVGDSLKITKQ